MSERKKVREVRAEIRGAWGQWDVEKYVGIYRGARRDD